MHAICEIVDAYGLRHIYDTVLNQEVMAKNGN